MVENVPVAHNDVDQTTLAMLPVDSPAAGLSSAITLSTPGVVADSNGFFHPLGDHAQTSYVHRWPAHQRSAKQGVFHADAGQRHPIHGDDHRHALRAIRR